LVYKRENYQKITIPSGRIIRGQKLGLKGPKFPATKRRKDLGKRLLAHWVPFLSFNLGTGG